MKEINKYVKHMAYLFDFSGVHSNRKNRSKMIKSIRERYSYVHICRLSSHLGGFQLLDSIITELQSHMTFYNSMLSLVEITAFRLHCMDVTT